MKLCMWGIMKKGKYCEESYFSVHADSCKSRQILNWFERENNIKSTYSLLTYIAVPAEFLPAGTERDLLQAALMGDKGVMLDKATVEPLMKEYERA